LACAFNLLTDVPTQFDDVEGPSPTELGGTGYFTVSGHVLDLAAADPEDGLCLLDLATLTFHHATISGPNNAEPIAESFAKRGMSSNVQKRRIVMPHAAPAATLVVH
jgi:hypothetical protein